MILVKKAHLILSVGILLVAESLIAQNLWTQQGATLTGSNPVISSSTGILGALSADGQTAVSFYSRDDEGSGFFVYRLNAGSWVKQAQIHTPYCAPGINNVKGGLAISADGNTIALDGTAYASNDTIWIYNFQNNSWTLQDRIVSQKVCKRAFQNTALSYDGNTLIYNAQIWVRSNNSWSLQANLLPMDRPLASTACFDTANRFSGAASCGISADGNTAIVGDLSVPDSGTCVWVFVRYGTNWHQQGPRLNGTGVSGFPFNSNSASAAVAISGDGNNIAVANNGSSKVWLFQRNGGTWSQNINPLLFPSLYNTNANLIALSYSGNRLVVSDGYRFCSAWKANNIWKSTPEKWPCSFATNFDSLAYRNLTGPNYQGSLGIDSSGTKAFFGVSAFRYQQGGHWYFTLTNDSVWQDASGRIYEEGVFEGSTQPYHTLAMSRDGSTIVVGRSEDNGSVGAAWVFKRNNNQWVQFGPKMIPPTGALWKPYGYGSGAALSANGNLLIIGAGSANYQVNPEYGNVYVYQNNGNAYVPLLDSLIPSQQQYGFGHSVAISDDGNTMMVTNAQVGVHFLFRSGNSWIAQAYFNNSIGFGTIALSGDGNTGVIANQLYGSFKGSITIFRRVGTVWTEEVTDMQKPFNPPGYLYFPFTLSLSNNGNILYAGDLQTNKTFYTERIGGNWSPLDTLFDGGPFFYQGRFVYSSQTGDTLFNFNDVSLSKKLNFFKHVGANWQLSNAFDLAINGSPPSLGDSRMFAMNGKMNEFALAIPHTASNYIYPQVSTIHVLAPKDLVDSTLKIKHASCTSTADGQIKIGILSGLPPYHFSWSNNAPDADSAINLLPGKYSAIISDAGGDTLYRDYLIQAISTPATLHCATTFNCNSGMGTATPNPVGGNPPYSFLWNTNPQQTSQTATTLLPGVYNYTVTDNNGCYYRDSAYIDSALMWATVNNTALNCFSSGTAIATVYGATPPFSYNWSTGDTIAEIQVPSLGAYIVTVTDINNCSVTSTYLPQQPCAGFIQGNVFFDYNNNCLQDTMELPAKNYMLLASGNGVVSYGVTDSLGHYFIQVVDTGSYSVSAAQWQSCPLIVCSGGNYPVQVSLTTLTNYATANFPLIDQQVDLTVLDETSQPFSGSSLNYVIYYGNRRDSVLPAATVTLVYDSIFSLDSTSPPFTTHNPATHSITWDVTNVGNIYSFSQYVTANFHTGFVTGQNSNVFLMRESISNLPGDCMPTNNSANHPFVIANAFDPNYKIAYPEGALSASDSAITYTIHFQNIGTGPTHFVQIVDTLPDYLNPASIQMVGASHYPYLFAIQNGNVLTWNFDPYVLPDSASDPIGSQGYICFTISLKSGVTNGTIIPNTAHIYFDYNPSVATNTVVNHVDLCLGLNSTPTSVWSQICSGDNYDFYGQQFTSTGNYQKIFTNVFGCDSVINLNLTVLPSLSSQVTASICSGSSYLFNGQNLTQTGVYFDTLTAANGCDSILTLNLAVMGQVMGSTSQNICTGSSYLFNGQNLTQTGVYFDTLTAANGCDSILALNLAVMGQVTGSISQNICMGSSYLFNGQNLTQTGVYFDTLTTANGCDSILDLTLTVDQAKTGSQAATICKGEVYLFNGLNLSVPGVYSDTLANIEGCDSIVTLDLSAALNDSVIVSNATCHVYQDSAIYQWIDCNINQQINGAVFQEFIAIKNGAYACIISKGNCTDTTDCVSINSIGINNEVEDFIVKLHPNPNNGEFVIEQHYPYKVSLQIADVTGRILTTMDLNAPVQLVNTVAFAGGVYQLIIRNSNQVLRVLRMVKE